MQIWLSEALDNCYGLADLIIDIPNFDDDTVSSFAASRITESFKICIDSLHITRKISENENISIRLGEILKPDLILYAPETQSVVIIELKNIAGPTRQAGTELGGYSAEIRTIIPLIADGDIVHVLISTNWPTLLRHFVNHQIFWKRENLLCLQPILDINGEIRLRILEVAELIDDSGAFRISPKHLGGYQICLYDQDLYSHNPDRNRLDKYVGQFNSALNSMTITGNRLNSHGFAFLSRDLFPASLSPYFITVVNIAPFQFVERFLHLDDNDLPDIAMRFIHIVQEYQPEGHGNTLSMITDACTDILESVCSPYPEGFLPWGNLRELMSGRTQHLSFTGWGLFGEAALDKLKKAYNSGDFTCSLSNPKLGMDVISEIINDDYDFISLSYDDLSDLQHNEE